MKDLLVKAYSVLIIALIIYVSGWLMFLSPIINIATCNTITGGMVVALIIKIILALPVAKIIYAVAIWIALRLNDMFDLI